MNEPLEIIEVPEETIHIQMPSPPFPYLEEKLARQCPDHRFSYSEGPEIKVTVSNERVRATLESLVYRTLSKDHRLEDVEKAFQQLLDSFVGILAVSPSANGWFISNLGSGCLVRYRERLFVATCGHLFINDHRERPIRPRQGEFVDLLVYFQNDLMFDWDSGSIAPTSEHCLQRDGQYLLGPPHWICTGEYGASDVGLFEIKNPEQIKHLSFINVGDQDPIVDVEERVVAMGLMSAAFGNKNVIEVSDGADGKKKRGLPFSSIDSVLHRPWAHDPNCIFIQMEKLEKEIEFTRLGQSPEKQPSPWSPPEPSGISGGPVFVQRMTPNQDQKHFELVGIFEGWEETRGKPTSCAATKLWCWKMLADEYIKTNPEPLTL